MLFMSCLVLLLLLDAGLSHKTPAFVLHGRARNQNYIFPGTITPVDKMCNVLSLEVEPRMKKSRADFVHSKGYDCHSDVEKGRKVLGSDNRKSEPQRLVDQTTVTVPFSKLSYGCRRNLIRIVATDVRMQVSDQTYAPLFPCLRSDGDKFWKDVAHLSDRRAMLIKRRKFGRGCIDWTSNRDLQICLSKEKKMLDCSRDRDDTRNICSKWRRLVNYIKDRIRQLFRRFSSMNKGSSCSEEVKRAEYHDFLSSGDTIGLTLRASTKKFSYYEAWPCIDRDVCGQIALYKLPTPVPMSGQEYAGLWGGTFSYSGIEDESRKALFYLVLSYCEETPGKRLLIATKILQGTNSYHHLHPNGSAMFIVNIDEPSTESFPWDAAAYSHPIAVKQAFTGEGIASGYSFRYYSSKPGSLFVLEDGALVFLWKETRSVLTLQRLNLEERLKKGLRVPVLHPIDNFTHFPLK